MANIDRGVMRYIHATATLEVNFPVDTKGREYVRCRDCSYLSSNERICQLNKKPVHWPDKTIGPNCPLKFDEEVEA